MNSHLRRLTATVCLGVVFVMSGAGAAWASFSSQSTAAATYTTATLAAASALSASNVNCVLIVGSKVQLAWAATPSTFADGYEIDRGLLAGGPYTQVGTVSGQSTTTFTDNSVVASTQYRYVVRATKAAWRSPNSNEASITTQNVTCA